MRLLLRLILILLFFFGIAVTRAAQSPVSATLSQALPGQIATGGTVAKTIYSFKNNLPWSITNLSFTTDAVGGQYHQITTTCSSTLLSKATCQWEGEFISGHTPVRGYATVLAHYGGNIVKFSQIVSITTSNDIVSGEVSTALPANLDVGVSAPLTFTFENTSSGAATGVSVDTPTLTGLSLSNGCGATLAGGATCTVSGTYTPPVSEIGNTITIPVTFNYAEGSAINLETNTSVSSIAVAGEVSEPLPADLDEGVSAPLTFTFENTSSGAATGVSVDLPTLDGLSLSNGCGATLAGGATCTVSGTYTPPVSEIGNTITIPVTFNYAEGSAINLETSTLVTDIAVAGEVSEPLPADLDEGVSAPLTFTFENTSSGTATGVSVDTPTLTGLSLSNGCGATLAGGATCTVSGTYTPPASEIGNTITIPVTFNYAEGSAINLETSTLVTDIAVAGEVSESLPADLDEGVSAPLTFTFENTTSGTATGVSVDLPTLTGLSLTDDCGATLAGGATCTVSGTYTPPASEIGNTITIPVTFNYAEGSAINLETSTLVTDIAVTGEVSESLPADLDEGVSAPLTFTFENTTSGTATGVSVDLPTLTGLSLSNGCGATLAGGATCTVSGTYTPPASEIGNTITIPVTFNYAEGSAIDLETSTLVTDIAVAGEVSEPLPADLNADISAPLTFTFENTTSGTATGVSVDTPTLTGLSLTNNCGTTLAGGATCTVSGTYTPPASEIGNTITVPVTFNYAEGSPIDLETSTLVSNIAVSGEVSTSLPADLQVAFSAPLTFTFENTSSGTATDVSVDLPTLTGLSLTNNCGTTLAGGATCTVSGTYIPPSSEEGNTITVPVMFNYAEGSPINLETSTVVWARAGVAYKFNFAGPFEFCAFATDNNFYNCAPITNPDFTTSDFIVAISAPFSETAFVNSGNDNTLLRCARGSTTGSLTSCTIVVSGDTRNLLFNPEQDRAYIPISSLNQADYYLCDYDTNFATITNCVLNNISEIATSIDHMAIVESVTTSATRVYLNTGSPNAGEVWFCQISSDLISFCEQQTLGAGITATEDSNIIANEARTYLYIMGNNGSTNALYRCAINGTLGNLENCTAQPAALGAPVKVMNFLPGTNTLMIGYTNGSTQSCNVDAVTGDLLSCSNTNSDRENFNVFNYSVP